MNIYYLYTEKDGIVGSFTSEDKTDDEIHAAYEEMRKAHPDLTLFKRAKFTRCRKEATDYIITDDI